MLTSLCQDVGLQPVNHLTTADIACDGGLKYEQKNNSQLDWALCSESATDNIEEFSVIRSYELPTNHAPIAIIPWFKDQKVSELMIELTRINLDQLYQCI